MSTSKGLKFDEILEGFDPKADEVEPLRSGGAVTIWLDAGAKARYDRLQEMSKKRGRRFSDVARETLKALIDLAEKRAG
jgi:hypothetical protein